jgi:hypothetical protein
MAWRITAIVVTALCVALAVTMFVLVERGRWVTAATELRWVDRDGKALGGDRTCISVGGFDGGIVLGDRWILRCYHDADHEGLFAFEPRRGDVRLLWPTSGHPVAMAVGDGDALGMVLESPNGDLVAIAGRDGWLHAPERFSTRDADVLGIAWNDGGVEVMFSEVEKPHDSGLFALPQLVRALPSNAPATTRPVKRPEGACAIGCANWLAFRDARRGWIEAATEGERHTMYIGEDGQVGDAPAHLLDEYGQLDERVDVSALGLGRKVWEVPERALMPDGTLAPYRASPFASMVRSSPSPVMYVRNARLVAEPWWSYRSLDAEAHVGKHTMMAFPGVFGGIWAQHVNKTDIVVGVASSLLSIGREPGHLHGVARLFGGAFAIHAQALIPDGDGFFLVGAEGLSVSLDANLHRRDPTSLREHLTTRGSQYKYEDATGNYSRLVFVLVGWAPAMLIGWLLSRRLGARGFIVAGSIYLVLAMKWALHLAPLLS